MNAGVQVGSAADTGIESLNLLAGHQAQRMATLDAGKCQIRHNDLLAKISMHSVLLAVLVAVALAAGLHCGGKAPPTLYYVLDLPSPVPAADPLDHAAILMPLRVGQVVGQRRIVYRESPEQIGFYDYHQWAEDPEDSIGRLLRGELLARGTFASVIPFDGRTRGDFVVRGELRRLEEVDFNGPVRVNVEIALELVDFPSGRVVWHGTSSSAENVPSSEVRSVVARMGVAVQRTVSELSARIDSHLRPPG